ncbi:MAG: flippase [Dehalococcoidia bacterium]|nr:flippase [Dehalococcoidia bacterium]
MFRQLLRLSKHSIIYGLSVAIGQVVAFFLIPMYTHYLTPADYGGLEIFQTTLSILSIILVMGLTTALFMSYFSYDDEEKRKTVVATTFLSVTGTSLILLLILMALAGDFAGLFFGSVEYTFHFRLIFLTSFFNVGAAVSFSVLRAREESKKYAIFVVIQFLVTAGLNILFVAVFHRGVLGILEGGLITACLLYSILLRDIIKNAKLSFSIAELKQMLGFGSPLVLASLAAWIMTMADRYFLKFLSTPTELGLYSLGYKFGMVVQGLIVGPFTLAWAPFFWSVTKERNAKEIYSSVLTYFALVATAVALVLSVLSKQALEIMAAPAFYEAYKVIPLIAVSYVLYGCYFILNPGIMLEKKTKYLALIVGVGAVLNLGLDYLLIPSYGMMGAAVATAISYLLLPIGSYFVSQRYYPIKYEWSRVAKIFVAAALVYAGSLFIKNDSAIITGLLKLACLLGFPLLLFAFRFFKPEETQKVRQGFKAAPGYVKLRLTKTRIPWRKASLVAQKPSTEDKQDTAQPEDGKSKENR